MTESRKQFEEWAALIGINIAFDSNYQMYTDERTELDWVTWQASRAAIVVKLPVKFPDNDDKDSAEVVYILDVLEQLALAGVRYE